MFSQIVSFENLLAALHECSSGKKHSYGYQRLLVHRGEKILSLSNKLTQEQFSWAGYREFYVCDPKRRLIMAAPFVDRIVHHAIHRVIEPILDKKMSDNVFACRHGRGTRAAIILLQKKLAVIGKNRYALKLDVSKFFQSINHEVLLNMILGNLKSEFNNNDSDFIKFKNLVQSLVYSHPEYTKKGAVECGENFRTRSSKFTV